MLVLLVNILHLTEVQSVVVENEQVFFVQFCLQVLPVESALQFLEERQRLLDTASDIESNMSKGFQSKS